MNGPGRHYYYYRTPYKKFLQSKYRVKYSSKSQFFTCLCDSGTNAERYQLGTFDGGDEALLPCVGPKSTAYVSDIVIISP